MIELDHVFIVCQSGGATRDALPANTAACAKHHAAELQACGFSVGSSNVHPGQGTSNVRFFVHRFMLEFLFVDDLWGLENPSAAILGLEERFTNGGASPFGICSRRSGSDNENAWYPHEAYRPGYLPEPLHVQVATDVSTTEPLWFHLPFVKSAFEMPNAEDSEPRDHASGATQLTACSIESPSEWSAQSSAIATSMGIALVHGDRHCLHLDFDGGQAEKLTLPASMNLRITL